MADMDYLYGGRGKADDVYMQRAQGLTKQPTGIEWGSGVQQFGAEELDQQEITRGESFSDLFTCAVYPAMRFGFLAQFLSLLMMIAVYHGQGGRNSFTYDIFNIKDTIRTAPVFTLMYVALMGIYTFGCLCLLVFQGFMSDNSKLSRGFRAGSKMLQSAVTLDMLVVAIRLLEYVHSYHFLATRWWLRYTQTKTDYSLFFVGATIHGIALILYGCAIFYMETYHDEGTYEEWAWLTFAGFSLAGISELLMVLTGWGAWFSLLQILSLASVVVWSFSFEPLLHFHSQPLHDRRINYDIVQPEDEIREP